MEYTVNRYDCSRKIMVITNMGCNLDCIYCYERHKENHTVFDLNETLNKLSQILNTKTSKGTLIKLLGGEPFEPENQQVLVNVLRRIRETYPGKNIWCYTGYLYDVDLIPGGKVFTDVTEEMLSYVDVLVDGPFVEAEKDLTLVFRGSRNQRILDLRQVRENG